MTELKECPFCGGEAKITEESDCFSSIFFVARCQKCLVDVRIGAEMTKSIEWNKKRVIEKWNNRWMIPCEEGETEGNWHTDAPTEEGLYLVAIPFLTDGIGKKIYRYETDYFNKAGKWRMFTDEVVAWQKIEPYKEN